MLLLCLWTMDADSYFDASLKDVRPWSDAEKAEAVLVYLQAVLAAMDRTTLFEFRAQCFVRSPIAGLPAILELLEKQLALR